MAAGDFTDVVQRGLYLARRATSNTFAVARAEELANEWHQSVCDSGHDWSFLRATGSMALTTGDPEYTFAELETGLSLTAGTLREVLAVVNDTDSSKVLRRVKWEELESLAHSTRDDDRTGAPVFYMVDNEVLRFYPTPDSADTLTFHVRLRPAVLSGTDSFLTPASWTARLATRYIAIELLQMDGSRDALSLADRLEARYEQDLKSFVGIYASPDEEITLRSPTFTDDLDVLDIDYLQTL